MKNRVIRWLVFFIALAAGIGFMAYPFIANYVFEHRKDSIIQTYDKQVGDVEDDETAEMLKAAEGYNESLFTGHVQLHDPFSEELIGQSEGDYLGYLSIDDTGVMGYIEIPSIGVSLPIYHGTSTETLEKGVGHLEGSSLPIGGENTHCVLTGHTGLSNAKMFTDLTELAEGDVFILQVLGEKLAYKVDQIKVIEPSELDDLKIVEGHDYCTLVTCTPYGVNSHRLLVRGERTEYTEEVEETAAAATEVKDSQWMREYRKALLISFLALAVGLVLVLLISRIPKGHGRDVARKCFWVLIVLIGLAVYLYPDIQEWRVNRRTEQIIQEFETRTDGVSQGADDSQEGETETEAKTEAWTDEDSIYEALYEEMSEYNENLVENGQEPADVWDYEQTPVDLSSLDAEDGAIGYIEIPDMDVTLPLYIGASEENMALGAAVMAGTSMPIGGTDTNSVIVGHRGYGGAPYFRDIELLTEGSLVYITNPWEKLTYEVTEIKIIDPHETEPILIQPGKDMITLLTCHPYMSHGKQRYLVYCERVEDTGDTDALKESETQGIKTGETVIQGTAEFESSGSLIRFEDMARKTAPLLILAFIAIAAFLGKRRQHRKRDSSGG